MLEIANTEVKMQVNSLMRAPGLSAHEGLGKGALSTAADLAFEADRLSFLSHGN